MKQEGNLINLNILENQSSNIIIGKNYEKKNMHYLR